MASRTAHRQLALPVPGGWGGRRAGAGRKPGPRPLVQHRARSPHESQFPLHLTLRARRDLGSLRSPRLYRALQAAVAAASRPDFRLVHFSVQGDHVQFIAEARDKAALSSGMRGLTIRSARAVNRATRRRGPVWADRYHSRDLATPRQVRQALCEVLNNARKHGRRAAPFDPCSSARWFDGWRDHDPVIDVSREPPPVAAPRTWLLAVGWRRHGLLRLDEAPQGANRQSP